MLEKISRCDICLLSHKNSLPRIDASAAGGSSYHCGLKESYGKDPKTDRQSWCLLAFPVSKTELLCSKYSSFLLSSVWKRRFYCKSPDKKQEL